MTDEQPIKCPHCDIPLELYSEPDMDGVTWHFAKCSKCGFEAAGEGLPITAEEMQAVKWLQAQLKNRGDVISA